MQSTPSLPSLPGPLWPGVVAPKILSMGWLGKSDSEVPVMQEVWVMRSTHSLPSLPGPLWSGVVKKKKHKKQHKNINMKVQ